MKGFVVDNNFHLKAFDFFYNSAESWLVDVFVCLFYLKRSPYVLGCRYILIKQKLHVKSAIEQIFDKNLHLAWKKNNYKKVHLWQIC